MNPILEALKTKPKTQKKKQLPEPPQDIYEEAFSLQEKKLQEEVRKLQIGNEKEIGNLVSTNLLVSVIGEIGQSFQNNGVDQAKRRSPDWAAQLGITAKEREIEKLIADLVQDMIVGVQSDIERLVNEDYFNV